MTYVTTDRSTCTHPTHSLALCAPKPVSLITRLAHMLRTKQQRAVLARLDDAQLCDLGLTRAQALAESKRPLWDVPANWRN